MIRSNLFASLAVLTAASFQVPDTVWAQTEIGQIVVTARKIEESLKDVPLAITAFDSAAIESAGISDLADIAAFTPGLTFYNALGEFLPVPIIRGVAPTDIFGENNAAIFVDGVFVSGREGLNFSQLDLERIEVVKGPQSALYGRNAFSGAINFVTRRPSDVLELKGEATAGNEGKIEGSMSISGPLVGDWIKGRAAVIYDEWDGSYDDPLGGNDVGGYRYRTYQASLEFDPTDDLNILLSGYYSDDEIDEAASTSQTANCEDTAEVDWLLWDPGEGAPYGPRLANICGKVWDLERINQELNQNIAGFSLADDEIAKIPRALGEDRDLKRANLNIDWDVGFGTVSLLTGYSSTKQTALADGTRNLGNDQPFLYCTGLADPDSPFCLSNGGIPPSIERFTTGLLQVQPANKTDEISQEIRFTSLLDRPFRFSVGAYFYDVSLDHRQIGVIATQPQPADLGYFCPCDLNILAIGSGAYGPWFEPGGDVDSRLSYELDTNAWAAFGWVEQDFLDSRLTVRAELRYSDEEKDLDYNSDVINVSFPEASPGLGHAKDSWDFFTGRLSLEYKLNGAWMAYTSIAKGEKAGAFDSDLVTLRRADTTQEMNVPVIVEVDTEQIVTTEIGVKGVTGEGRVGIDLALFHSDWDDVVLPQILETDPDTGLALNSPAGFNANSGDATIWGWELLADFAFTDNLTGRLGVSWTDAELDDARQESYSRFPSFYTSDATCTPEAILALPTDAERRAKGVACRAVSGDVSGNQLLRQSEWQASASLTYRRPFRDDWEWYSRADATYQDSWYVGSDNQGYIPSHTYVNLRLGVESRRYTVELWGENLFEDDAPIGAFRDVYFNNTPDVLQQNPPQSSFVADFFPWRLTVTHPKLRTYGITARVRFGGAT